MTYEPHDSYRHEARQTAALERIVRLLETLIAQSEDNRPTGGMCSDSDCVRDGGHKGLHYNLAGQVL